MNKYVFILILCLASHYVMASDKDTTSTENFIVGLRPHFVYYELTEHFTGTKKLTYFSLYAQPFVGVHVYKWIYVGASGAYEFFRSNFQDKDPYCQLGVFIRYAYRLPSKRRFWKRLELHPEFGYQWTNHFYTHDVANSFEYDGIVFEEKYIIDENLRFRMINISLSAQFDLGRNIYIGGSWGYIQSIGGDYEAGLVLEGSYKF